MNTNNKFDSKTESSKFEPKTTIEKKMEDIKDDHMENIIYFDMKI